MKNILLSICASIAMSLGISFVAAMDRHDETLDAVTMSTMRHGQPTLSGRYATIYNNKRLISFIIGIIAATSGYRLTKHVVVSLIKQVRYNLKVKVGPLTVWSPGLQLERSLSDQYKNVHVYAALVVGLLGYFLASDIIDGTLPVGAQLSDE